MKTTKLSYGGMMPQDFNKTTPNIRSPRQESETDFGKTNVYIPDDREYSYQTPQPVQTPQQHQPQQKKAGIPIWAWAIAGAAGFFLLLIAIGIVAYILTRKVGFTVIVKNAPANSKVFVDNTLRGTTTRQGDITVYNLEAGPKRILVTNDCFNDYFENVRGENGDELEVTAKMASKPCGAGPKPSPISSPTQAPEDVIANRIEKDLTETGRARVKEITFDTNKDTIKPFSALILVKVAEILKRHPDWNISIEGHTDNQGSAGHNLPLSERRAKASKDYLIGLGIAPNRLSSAGFGLSRPVESNDTDAGREQNRRVEFVKK